MAHLDITKLTILITAGQLPSEVDDGTPIGSESFDYHSPTARSIIIFWGQIIPAINAQLLRPWQNLSNTWGKAFNYA